MCIVTFKVDEETKKRAQQIFSNIGITMSTALNVFLKSCINNNGIPFELKGANYDNIPISYDVPNKLTAQAIAEGDRIASDPSVKGYTNIDDLRKALGV